MFHVKHHELPKGLQEDDRRCPCCKRILTDAVECNGICRCAVPEPDPVQPKRISPDLRCRCGGRISGQRAAAVTRPGDYVEVEPGAMLHHIAGKLIV